MNSNNNNKINFYNNNNNQIKIKICVYCIKNRCKLSVLLIQNVYAQNVLYLDNIKDMILKVFSKSNKIIKNLMFNQLKSIIKKK